MYDSTGPVLHWEIFSHRSTGTNHSWEYECISVYNEETTQEQLTPVFSLLPVLMRSNSIPCSSGELCEIISDQTCVITTVKNYILYKAPHSNLLGCTCHQLTILPNTSLLTSPTTSKQKNPLHCGFDCVQPRTEN